ncbi:hypothetical protein [Bradyrhizobium sp. USDA 10063]
MLHRTINPMIRIELGEETDRANHKRHGIWHWCCPHPPLSGYSRQPLLDACRELQRIGVDSRERVALFRPGCDRPELSCTVAAGAGTTVDEAGPRFRKFEPFDPRLRNRARVFSEI